MIIVRSSRIAVRDSSDAVCMTLTSSSWDGCLASRGLPSRIAADPSVRLTAVRFCTGPS